MTDTTIKLSPPTTGNLRYQGMIRIAPHRGAARQWPMPGRCRLRARSGDLTLHGGLDAPADSLPGLVVVGAGIVDGGLAAWRVSIELSVPVRSAASEGGVQRLVDS